LHLFRQPATFHELLCYCIHVHCTFCGKYSSLPLSLSVSITKFLKELWKKISIAPSFPKFLLRLSNENLKTKFDLKSTENQARDEGLIHKNVSKQF